MAYMKDSEGRRLDSFEVADASRVPDVGVAATGNTLTKVGVVIPVTAEAWDNTRTESLAPTWAPDEGRIVGVYTGYGNTSGSEVAGIGLARSSDGVTWQKAGRLLAGSGVAGSPDRYGCTGPLLVFDNGLWHLFYIGLTDTGYEGGAKTICVATTPSLTSPVFTRRGSIITPAGSGWRGAQVWHPSIVRSGATWYCFFNASSSVDLHERIGYATAPALLGPWTVQDADCPLVDINPGDTIAGDPCVTRTPGGWRMDFFRANGTTAGDYYAITTDTEFPRGWRMGGGGNAILAAGGAGSYDAKYAHKPIIMRIAGRVFHYYTAVDAANNRRCALAVDPPLTAAPNLVSAPVVSGTDTASKLASLLAALQTFGLQVAATVPVVADGFSRADGSTLGSTEIGAKAWVTGGAAGWAIASGQLAWTGTADGQALVNAGVSDNVDVAFRVTSIAGQYPVGICFGSSATSFVKIYRDQTNNTWIARDAEAGAGSMVSRSVPTDLVANDVIRLRKQGSTLTLYINDAQVAQWTGWTYHVGSGDTFYGVIGSGTLGLMVDNFSVTSLA